MTKEKLKSLFSQYRAVLDVLWPDSQSPEYVARQLSEHQAKQASKLIPHDNLVAHCKFMCDEAQRLVDAGKVEKAMRWLGFLQGVLWESNLYTLDELKNHSRPDGVGVVSDKSLAGGKSG